MSRSQWLRGVVATVLMATCVAGWGQQALPPLQQKVNLDIPSQPVAGALTALGRQSGLTIMLAAAAPSNAVSPAVVGDYTPDEALRRILESSGLKAEYLDQKTVKVAQANSDGQKRKDDSSAAQGKVRKTAPPSKPTSNRTEP